MAVHCPDFKFFSVRFAIFLLLVTFTASLPEDWERLSSTFLAGSDIAQLDAGISTAIWAVDLAGKPHVKVGLKGQWSKVNGLQNSYLSWVSSGAAGVWAVHGSLGLPVYRDGVSELQPEGTAWAPVEGRGFKIIESGLPGCVYALTRTGELYYRSGINELNKRGVSWKPIWGKYRFLSAGSYGLWAIDFYNIIYFGRGSSAHLSLFKYWKQVDRPLSRTIHSVVAGFGGSVWCLTDDGSVFRRTSVNVLNPTGTENGWKQVAGLRLSKINAGLHGVIGVTKTNELVAHQDRKCGGLFQEVRGTFATPNYPRLFPKDVVCLWVIHIPKARSIFVTIEDSDTDGRTGDFLVYSQSDTSTHSRLKLTGKGEHKLTFKGETALLEFISERESSSKGFFARYNSELREKIPATTPNPTTVKHSSGCGGAISQNSGSITSPNYPKKYKSNSDCIWVISVQPGKMIKFTVTGMNIEYDSYCRYDFLRIGDGAVKGSETRATICGTRSYSFVSKGNKMWVQFFSDSQVERNGFNASWTVQMISTTAKPTTAPTTRTPVEGWKILSSLYPQRVLQIDSGMTERLLGIDSRGQPVVWRNTDWSAVQGERMLHASTGDSGMWAIDTDNHVRYRSGTNSPAMGNTWEYIGSDSFKKVDSGPKGFVLGIRSNGILAYRDDISSSLPFGRQWINLGQNLKSVSTGSYGIWGVGDFGTVYFARRPSNLKVFPLSWRVIAGPVMTKIDAGFGNHVWGLTVTGQLIQREGVSHDTPFGTDWAYSEVVLKDVTVGFRGVFGITKDGAVSEQQDKSHVCGGILTTPTGRIVSPGYPLFSYSKTHCLWVIRVPSAQRIRLDVSYFNVRKSLNCLDDYVLLYKRGYYSPEYGADKFCGTEQDINPSITYNGNEVWLQFHAGSQPSSYRGFEIRYMATVSEATALPTTSVTTKATPAERTVATTIRSATTKVYSGCGGDFTSPFGALTSPGFPNRYQINLKCVWKINVGSNRALTLKFDQFSVEDGNRCQYDYLLIKTSENGRQLGRFCGTRSQPDITVGGNTAWLYFNSDDSVRTTGFRMLWSSKLKDGFTESPTKAATTKRQAFTPSATTAASTLPQNWSKVKTNFQFAHVDGGISPNAWAVDIRGGTYFQSGNMWRLVGQDNMIWITSGESGVWGIDMFGKLFYREGVTRIAPKGIDWKEVKSAKLNRIDSGPAGALLALDDNGNLLLREGATARNPTGTGWNPVGSGYKHLSVGSYGYWAVSDRNEVFFATILNEGPLMNRLRWSRVGGRFSQVKAGFGSSLWAVAPEGELYERKGINAITPTGLRWRKEGSIRASGVTTGMSGVFAAVQGSNQLITKPDRICGDIFTARSGSFKSPQHPSNYPSNATCLWQIKVPGASQIRIEFDNFQLEEGQRNSPVNCNSDYLLYLLDGQFPSAFGVKKRCGRDGAPIVFDGDKAWLEFVSDDVNNYSGFSARYNAVMKPGSITDKPFTSTKSTDTEYPTTSPLKIYKGCGGLIDATKATTGLFAHPNYPSNYGFSRSCEYTIRTNPGRRIQVNFELFDLEHNLDCLYDSMVVRDGDRATASFLGRYCGSAPLKSVTSTGNSLYFKFKSDPSSEFKGYLARWTVIVPTTTTKMPATTTGSGLEGPKIGEIMTSCGGVIDASIKSSGYIAHPNYPGGYSNNANCTYMFRASPGRKIKLMFERFSLEQHEVCRDDFLEVKGIKGSQQVRRFCGKEKPAAVESLGNHLTVLFSSDYAITSEGFLIKWYVDNDSTLQTTRPQTTTAKRDVGPINVCGGTFMGENGLFATPNYPGNYPHNLDCEWRLVAGENKRIQLTFEYFNLEKSGDSCRYDNVQIFDVVSKRDVSLGKYCNEMDKEFTSTGNELKVLFHSDAVTNEKGFVARWVAQGAQTMEPPSQLRTTEKPCFEKLSGLGGKFGNREGSLSHGAKKDCIWLITVATGRIIKLELLHFNFVSRGACGQDSLRIFDGPTATSPTIGNICKRPSTSVVYSTGNQVRIHFTTSGKEKTASFEIQWSTVSPAALTTRLPVTTEQMATTKRDSRTSLPNVKVDICDGSSKVIKRDSGTMTSFKYPRYYPPSQRCWKMIETSLDKRLIISFDDVTLEPSMKCQNDAVEITDGDFYKAVCGFNIPDEIKAPGNRLKILFRSDLSLETRGFKLRWRSEPLQKTAPPCGGRLYGSSGLLESPKFEGRFPFTVSCTWILEVGPSSSISFMGTFKGLHTRDCQSSLLFRDGMNSTSPLIKNFCRSVRSLSFTSRGNVVYIEHKVAKHTESSFQFRWQEKTRNSFQAFKCGGTKTKSSGSIASPRHPFPHPKSLLCTWLIVAPNGYRVSMDFKSFMLEPDKHCTNDYLMIRNGLSSVSDEIGRYCGMEIPRRVISNGNSVWLQLKTDCKTSFSGFKMTWKFVKRSLATTPDPSVTQVTSERARTRSTTEMPTTRPTTPTTLKRTTRRSTLPQTTATPIDVNAHGGMITGRNGIIQSPNYPRPYPNNADITWVLKGPAAGRISIRFTSFMLEEDSACRYDLVELRDGETPDSPLLGKFCGGILPSTFVSADNSLFVYFKSDVSEKRAGFQARWEWSPTGDSLPASRTERSQINSACGGTLTEESGEVSTPRYPASYSPSAECVWIIKPKSGKAVELSFRSFDLEPESRCGYDFVEIRDGTSSKSPRLGKFCGSALPDVQYSSNGAMFIKFKSDSSTGFSGFLASWKTISGSRRRRRRDVKSNRIGSPACSYAISGNNGKLKLHRTHTSSDEGSGTFCTWTIKTAAKRYLFLNIKRIGFNKHSSCSKNYMDIFSVHGNRHELLARLCPLTQMFWRKGIIFPTSSRRIFVKYVAEGKSKPHDFKVKWTTSLRQE